MRIDLNLSFDLSIPADVIRFENVSRALVQPVNLDLSTGEPLSQEVTVYATAGNQLEAVERVLNNKDPEATVKTETLAEKIKNKVKGGAEKSSDPLDDIPTNDPASADNIPTNDPAPADNIPTNDPAPADGVEGLKERIRSLLLKVATSDKVDLQPSEVKLNAAKAAGVGSFREVTAELAPKVIAYLEGLLS